jgi:uroporphyrinogen-III synthase
MGKDETADFGGLRVLALESRRASEVSTLIKAHGGVPTVAPALREVPIDANREALAFAAALVNGEFDIVIFLTGVGPTALARAIEPQYAREAFAGALMRTKVVARGPKPLAVLREMRVPVWVMVPEPNTWRELLAAIEARADEQPLNGARVAVQEYGVSNVELLDALVGRGAKVSTVPVYRWALPENIEPLRAAVTAIADGAIDVAIFTSSIQLVHLWQIVQDMGLETPVRNSLAHTVIASIGPTTSEELRRHDLAVDVEATHPKFGMLVRELAERSPALLQAKRRRS